MAEYSAILRSLDVDKFKEVLSASARQARETYFHRHAVRTPKMGRRPKPGAKNELRAKALYEVIQDADDDEMAEELLRTWLLTKRPLLAAALEHLGIPHDNGLTESEEVTKFEKLSAKELKGLVKKLHDIAGKEDIGVYLRFMGAPNVEKVLS